jgi:hypothetical protein
MCFDFELKCGLNLVKQPTSNNKSPELPSVVVEFSWVGSRKINVHECIKLEGSQDMKDLISPNSKARLWLELGDV